MRRVLHPRRTGALTAAVAAATALAACGGQEPLTDSDNAVRGKQLFVAKCGSCHVMQRAGTKGNVGPNLDTSFRQSLGEGFGRSVVRGVVEYQIQYPQGPQMPADLVKGDDVGHVASYVATAVSKAGEDEGVLATAVQPAGAGKPAVAKGGTLEIDADPSGQLAFVTDEATSKPGAVTLKMDNPATVPHNIALRQGATQVGTGKVVQKGGVSSFEATLKAGTYEFLCTVQGHAEGGMKGKLTVR